MATPTSGTSFEIFWSKIKKMNIWIDIYLRNSYHFILTQKENNNRKNIKTTDASLLLESRINDYNTKERDPRLVRHVISCVEKEYEKVVVRTVDTDSCDYRVISRIWMKSNEIGEPKIYALMRNNIRFVKHQQTRIT